MATIYLNDNELDNYLHTLEICKNNLPGDAHQSHYDRLNILIEKFEKTIKNIKG